MIASTVKPETTPTQRVLEPICRLTALRVQLADVGMHPKKAPTTLPMPLAASSWLA